MKYFITGHTGFKGAWLSLMLSEMGHELHGYSFDPVDDSLFDRASLQSLFASDIRADVRDADELKQHVKSINPAAVIHLAAQPLVRYGYRHPEETYSTNFGGTLNLLAAIGTLDSLEAALIVTTDKVYLNTSKSEGYVETDPLGGLDPYSASKASADILSQSWSHSFPEVPVAIARAGNVIGGGDVSEDRLLPDLVKAFSEGREAKIRNPLAVRPWQHVLDCLEGYLMLIDGISKNNLRGSWNFGPDQGSCQPVEVVANLAQGFWGDSAKWLNVAESHTPHEDSHLILDSAKAQEGLGWKNRYDLNKTVGDTIAWEKNFRKHSSARELSQGSVNAFFEHGG
jgi:CDP-glucose 4,6-dehydratase